MKVLVTGATSGLGRNAVEYLRRKGISVRASGRNEAMGKLLEKMGAEFVHADKSPAPEILDAVLEAMKDRGFIIGKNGVARNVMAFQPPLIITAADIDQVLNALELVLTEQHL